MGTASNRPLLVVAAEPRELQGILRRCRNVRRLGWPVRYARAAVLEGLDLVLIANGCGERLAGEACEAAWSRRRAAALVSAGFCGALDAGLAAGDIVVADRVIGEDGTVIPAARPADCARPCRTAALISVGRVVLTASEKARLGAAGAVAVEMEALAVGLRARQWGVPFHAVKAVTDTAEEDLKLDLNAARRRDGSLSTMKILVAAARSPRRLAPELIALYHRSHRAAGALGEFFANCRF